MKFQAVIFDLDGTLIESTSIWSKIDEEFFAKRNMKVPLDYFEKIKSFTFTESAEYTKKTYNFPESVEEIKQEWLDMAEVEYYKNIKIKEGVKEYLKYLKENKIKIGLATAAPRNLYEGVLKNNDIYIYFDTFSDTSEVGKSKESPDVYILAAEKLGVAPSECLVFEDILSAIKTAKSIGMTVCGVYDECSLNDKEEILDTADFYINSFREMLE